MTIWTSYEPGGHCELCGRVHTSAADEELCEEMAADHCELCGNVHTSAADDEWCAEEQGKPWQPR